MKARVGEREFVKTIFLSRRGCVIVVVVVDAAIAACVLSWD